MANIQMTNLTLSADDLNQVQGGGMVYPKIRRPFSSSTRGVALLLPAVQKLAS